MNLFVAIKQVPSTNKVEVDEATGVLKRDGVDSKMNPYDLFALEEGLRLKASTGGRLVVGTMGPPQAASVLREALMMGADEAYLFSDRRLGGADVLATSYTLSQAIRAVGDFDVILCGKQTTDGDTAQVGPAIAEHMGIPHAAWVSHMAPGEHGLTVRQQLSDTVETVTMPFPCLVTVEQDINTPRLPSLRNRRQILAQTLPTMGLQDFMDTDATHYGLTGSPTQVERIFPPQRDGEQEIWTGDGLADRLADYLKAQKYI